MSKVTSDRPSLRGPYRFRCGARRRGSDATPGVPDAHPAAGDQQQGGAGQDDEECRRAGGEIECRADSARRGAGPASLARCRRTPAALTNAARAALSFPASFSAFWLLRRDVRHRRAGTRVRVRARLRGRRGLAAGLASAAVLRGIPCRRSPPRFRCRTTLLRPARRELRPGLLLPR